MGREIAKRWIYFAKGRIFVGGELKNPYIWGATHVLRVRKLCNMNTDTHWNGNMGKLWSVDLWS